MTSKVNPSTEVEEVEVQVKEPVSKMKMKKCRYKTDLDFEHQIIWFDYETAKAFYEEHAGDNRPVGIGDLKRNATMMVNGEWALTHQSIGIDINNQLIDGQHRLLSIIYAYEKLGCLDIEIPILVCWGCDPKSFDALDQGRLRKAKDAFAIAGRSYPDILDVAVRLHWIRCHGQDVRGTGKLRIREMEDWLKEHKTLEDVVVWIMEGLETPIKTFMSPGYAAALCYLMGHSEVKGAVELSEEFWHKFVDDDFEEGYKHLRKCESPRILRKYLLQCVGNKEMKLDRDALVNLVISAWLAFVNDDKTKSITELKPKKGQRFVIGGLDVEPDTEDEEDEE